MLVLNRVQDYFVILILNVCCIDSIISVAKLYNKNILWKDYTCFCFRGGVCSVSAPLLFCHKIYLRSPLCSARRMLGWLYPRALEAPALNTVRRVATSRPARAVWRNISTRVCKTPLHEEPPKEYDATSSTVRKRQRRRRRILTTLDPSSSCYLPASIRSSRRPTRRPDLSTPTLHRCCQRRTGLLVDVAPPRYARQRSLHLRCCRCLWWAEHNPYILSLDILNLPFYIDTCIILFCSLYCYFV